MNYLKKPCLNLTALSLLLLLLLITSGCSTVSAPLGEREDATPWSTLYYSPIRPGGSPDALQPPFTMVWSKKIRPFEHFKIYPPEQRSVPVMDKGVLYVGSTDERLYAFDYAEGSRLWRFDAGSPIESTPTVSSKAVCFGTSDGALVCLDRESGDPLWTFQTGSEIISSPIVTENSVYFYSSTDRLFALDLASGREVWSYRRPSFNMVAPRGRTSPALSSDGEKILQVFSDGSLLCFETFTGKILWEKKLYKPDVSAGPFRKTPSVLGDTVFVPGKDLVVQARLVESGRVIKTYDAIPARAFITIERDRILLASASEVALVDVKSGETLWKKESIEGKGAISAVSVSGDTVLVLMNTEKTHLNLDFLTSRKGHILAMDLENGNTLWKKTISSTLSTGVSASGGAFALLTDKGILEVWGK